MRYSVDEVKAKTPMAKEREQWWIALVINPIAIRLVYLFQGWLFITPNRITLLSFLIGILGAISFAFGAKGYLFLVFGVICFQLFLLINSMDGKLARLRECPTRLGGLLDEVVSTVVIVAFMGALTVGGYMISGSNAYLFAGLLWFAPVLLMYLLRYNVKIWVGEEVSTKLTALSKSVKSKAVKNLESHTSRTGLLPFPSDTEVYLIVFGIAPLMGQILIGIYIAAGYFWVKFIADVILFFWPLPKAVEGEDQAR